MTTLTAPNAVTRTEPTLATQAVPTRTTHWLAWGVWVTTLPLISLGGLVTSTGAGMAVPDWPNSFGYNMFALPWGQWLGEGSYTSGVFQEHAHRLFGTAAGFAAILLCGWAWWKERSTMVRMLATVVLLAVIVQGLMGGFRVTENSRLLSFLHGVFGQIVFATMTATIVVTSKWWWVGRKGQRDKGTKGRSAVARRLAWVTGGVLALIVVQLLLGAAMRHDPARNHLTGSGPGLAIPDWPLHYGNVLPPASGAALDAANAERAAMDLPPATMHGVWLHFAHRAGAYLTLTAALGLAWFAIKKRKFLPAAWWLAATVGGLCIVQATLGILTVLLRKPADVATTHQFVGAILLATATAALLRAWRSATKV
jgi:cytochrome c oxidase assembly protein subunit 15